MTVDATEPHGYAHAEITKVLDGLAGENLYWNNVFRITGLPTDAGPRQIRRRREEAAIGGHMLLATDPTQQTPPLPPATDPDELDDAFEALQNPILRFVHELLWVGGPDPEHDAVVRRHCAAVEDDDGTVSSTELAEILSQWWRLLDDADIWSRARDRLTAIDDPRLTIGVIRILEDRFPEFLARSHAVIAAEAVDDDDALAYRHLRALQRSDLPAELVADQLRAAVQPAEQRIDTVCTAALGKPHDESGARLAGEVLDDTETPLSTITVLLGEDHFLTHGVRDQIARTVNLCAIAHYNRTWDGAAVLAPLERALELVDSDALRRTIQENVTVVGERVARAAPPPVRHQRYRPPPTPDVDVDHEHLDEVLRELIVGCAVDSPERTLDRVRAAVHQYPDPIGRLYLAHRTTDPRLLAVDSGTIRFTFNPFWLSCMGHRDHRTAAETGEAEDTYITTVYLLGGLIPVRSYIIATSSMVGDPEVPARRVPLSDGARAWRGFLIPTLVFAALMLVGWTWWVAALTAYLGALLVVGSRNGMSH